MKDNIYCKFFLTLKCNKQGLKELLNKYCKCNHASNSESLFLCTLIFSVLAIIVNRRVKWQKLKTPLDGATT